MTDEDIESYNDQMFYHICKKEFYDADDRIAITIAIVIELVRNLMTDKFMAMLLDFIVLMIIAIIVMMSNLMSESFMVMLRDLMMLMMIAIIMMMIVMCLTPESFMVMHQNLILTMVMMIMNNLMVRDFIISAKAGKSP